MALKKPRLNGGAFLFAAVNVLLLQLLNLREAGRAVMPRRSALKKAASWADFFILCG